MLETTISGVKFKNGIEVKSDNQTDAWSYPHTPDLTISRLEYTVAIVESMMIGLTISCNHFRLIRSRECSGVRTASQIQIEGGNG